MAELLSYVNSIREDLKTNIIHLHVAKIVIHVNNKEEFNNLINELDKLKNVTVGVDTRRYSYDKFLGNLCICIDGAVMNTKRYDTEYKTGFANTDWFFKHGYQILEYSEIRGSLY